MDGEPGKGTAGDGPPVLPLAERPLDGVDGMGGKLTVSLKADEYLLLISQISGCQQAVPVVGAVQHPYIWAKIIRLSVDM